MKIYDFGLTIPVMLSRAKHPDGHGGASKAVGVHDFWVRAYEFFTKANQEKFILSVLLFLIFQFGCSQDPSPYDELIEHEFYAYIVPNSMLLELGWELGTPTRETEGQWDIHCEGGISAPDAPLLLFYFDDFDELQLTISISSRGAAWDHNKPTENVRLDKLWAAERTGVVYKDEPNSSIRFEDIFGNKVIVRGDQAVDEKIHIVNQLEYIGQPRDKQINPWSVEWCERNQRASLRERLP